MSTTIRQSIFISYAHEDAEWRDRFIRMLQPAVRAEALQVWSDEEITAGDHWKSAIEARMRHASIALLLVSEHFLASDFINDVELPAILEAATQRGLRIHWVPISACAVEYTPLAQYQACWPPDRPLVTLTDAQRGTAIRDICADIYCRGGQLVRTSRDERDALKERVREVLPEGLGIEIGEPVGGGSHAVVYEGKTPSQRLAIKVLVDSPLRQRTAAFRETANLASDYQHPCFIRIRHVFVDQDPQFLVMDYIDAPSVSELLERDGPFQPDDVVRLLLDAAEALDEHHRNELVYGALYPDDIYIDQNGRLRLSALGISSYLATDDAIQTYFPRSRRAATYMGPEQFAGLPMSARSDQYALGLLAFEMLQGAAPILIRCPADLGRKHRFFADPAVFAGAWKERHPALAEVIFKMLHKNAEERWESLAEVAAVLDGLESEARAMAKASYRRHCRNRPDFYAAFYQRFFSRCPETRALFGDLETQYRRLEQALMFLLNFDAAPIVEPTILSETADRHKLIPVTNRQFDEFAQALLDTLRDFCGERAAVLNAWRECIDPGLNYIRKASLENRAAGRCPWSGHAARAA